MRTAVTSVTFRQLKPEEIIELTLQAQLDAIEWGGDIHIPHGDLFTAQKVGELTRKAGLCVSSYGSYYRVGTGNEDFNKILDTALALQAPLIRVWAGNVGSKDATDAWWDKVVSDARKIAMLAEKQNIKVAFEYHGGTLTDTPDSTDRLLQLIDHQNIMTYWQPLADWGFEYRLDSLTRVLPHLANVHVFHWSAAGERYPLQDGIQYWQGYLKKVRQINDEFIRYAIIEFVRNDDKKQFLEDARTLKSILTNQDLFS
ncbi:MAG: sugar phosphate isomerase/epimerase [Firmicutes bacterium]|nr:sugar phosphate isomerase/epimerase [Bacillota bacterium]